MVSSSNDSIVVSAVNSSIKTRLLRLIAEARSNVEMYRRIYAEIDVPDQNLSVAEILRCLPLTSKQQLLEATADERLNRRFASKALLSESTTGSTGQPFTLAIDPSYRRKRNWRFMKGLSAAGFRPWQRLMLLTDRYSTPQRRYPRLSYVPVEQPASAIASAYQAIRPDVLYGFLTPLRLLAEHLPPDSCRPRIVISTAEMLDPLSRKQLESAYRCPVVDFYGLTEMGLVAWQRSAATGYVISSNSVLTELIPATDGKYKVVLTNLDLLASPIIRFDSGDLATVKEINGSPTVTSIDGRCIDTLVRRDGVQVSPYELTDSLRDIDGLKRFKVTQRSIDNILVELEVSENHRQSALQDVRALIEQLLGTNLEMEFQIRENIVAEGSVKFRPVESRVARS